MIQAFANEAPVVLLAIGGAVTIASCAALRRIFVNRTRRPEASDGGRPAREPLDNENDDAIIERAARLAAIAARASVLVNATCSAVGVSLSVVAAYRLRGGVWVATNDNANAVWWGNRLAWCVGASFAAQALFSAYPGVQARGPYSTLGRIPALFRAVILAPQALFFPAIYALFNSTSRTTVHYTNTEFGAAARKLSHGKYTTRAARMSLQQAVRELLIQSHFAGQFHDHMDSHIPLYIDSVLGSLPQACIMLMAYGALQAVPKVPHALLIAGVVVDIAAVLLKLPGFLVTFDVRLQAFRVACGAHDICSLFCSAFAVATMVRLPGATWQLFGLSLTGLGFLWMAKVTITFVAFGIGLSIFYVKKVPTADRWAASLIMLVSTPALALCCETTRLSLFGWLALSKSPKCASFRILVDFLAESRSQAMTGTDHRPIRGSRWEAVERRVRMQGSTVHAPWTFFSEATDANLISVLAPLQAFSFAFPFCHAVLNWRYQSTMHLLLLSSVVITLVPVLTLLPFAIRRYRIIQLMKWKESVLDIDAVISIVHDHLRLTDLRVLLGAISEDVMPRDVTELVLADYLDPVDIDTNEWTAAQFDSVKQGDVEY